jgi:hypothetical protein
MDAKLLLVGDLTHIWFHFHECTSCQNEMLNASKISLHNCNQILYEMCSGNKEALQLHCYLGISILLPVLEDSCCSGG